MSVMTADQLRRAAAALREAATTYRWAESYEQARDWDGLESLGDDPFGELADLGFTDYVLADMLSEHLYSAAARYDRILDYDIETRSLPLSPEQAEVALASEFAIARRILGEGA